MQSLPAGWSDAMCLATTAEGYCITSFALNGSFAGCSSSPRYLVMQAMCTDSTNTTLSRPLIGQLVYLLNAISVLVLLIGVWWLRVQQEVEIEDKQATTCRPSDYTAQVQLPASPFLDNAFTRERLIEHFEHTLSTLQPIVQPGAVRVADLNYCSSCTEYVQSALQRGKYARLIDKAIAKYIAFLKNLPKEQSPRPSAAVRSHLQWLLYRFEQFNARCEALTAEAVMNIHTAHVTFETEEGLLRCLQYFPKSLGGKRELDGFLEVEGKPLVVRRPSNPSEIKWEYVGITWMNRIFRTVLSSGVLLAVLLGSYACIYEVHSSIAQLPNSSQRCADGSYDIALNTSVITADANTITYQKVLWDQNRALYNLSTALYGSNGYLACFCEELYNKQGQAAMQSFGFYNIASGSVENWCTSVYTAEYQKVTEFYYIAFIVIGVNLVLSMVIPHLVALECWADRTSSSLSLVLKTFLAQYINIALLTLLIYGAIDNISSTARGTQTKDTALGVFAGPFKDFNADW